MGLTTSLKYRQRQQRLQSPFPVLITVSIHKYIANIRYSRITARKTSQAEPVRTVVLFIFALSYIRIHSEYY